MATAQETTQTLTQKLISKLNKELKKNAEVYSNSRVQVGQIPKANQLISNVGFVDHPYRLSVSHFAPRPGEYTIYPKSKGLRPWRYIVLHMDASTWDTVYLKQNTTALKPPVDTNGHNPDRWLGLLQRYIIPIDGGKKTRSKLSAHYLVNRLGEVVVSVDLNDIAYHMPTNQPKLFKSQDNNTPTVGIVLEPCYGRATSGGTITLLDLSERQYAALAVLIKKLTTITPIEQVAILKSTLQPIQIQTAQNPTGFIQTFDVGKSPAPITDPTVDPKLYQLRPEMQEIIARVLTRMKARTGPHTPFFPKIGNAFRTWAQQAQKVRDGYAGVGPNANNPGPHNWGLACDIISNFKGDEMANPRSIAFYQALGEEVLKEGLVWGGSWMTRGGIPKTFAPGIGWDPGHCQYPHIPREWQQEYHPPGLTYFGTTPDGMPGPGWTKLFGLVNKVRKFNLATDVFLEKIIDPDFSEMQQLASQIQKGTLGQRMATMVAYHRAQGLKRATGMQNATRAVLAKAGVTNASSLHTSANQSMGAISAVTNRADATNASALEGGPRYDFTTGRWHDNKAV